MKRQQLYIAVCGAVMAAAATPATSAQTLSQEVIINREITPVERPAVRPAWVNPYILTPRVQMKQLSPAEYVDASEITRTLPPLQAAAWADSVMRNPYRGYASIGYFPAYNLGMAAGYRFVHDRKIDAGAHISYDGSTWNGFEDAESKYSRHRFGLGADAAVHFASGTLTADFNYVWSATGAAFYPGYYDRGKQGLNTAGLALKWQPAASAVRKFGWNIGADIEYGGFTNNMTKALPLFNTHTDSPYDFEPVKDFNVGLTSDLSMRFGRHSILLGLGAHFRHVNRFTDLVPQRFYSVEYNRYYGATVPADCGGSTLGIITLRPAYNLSKNNVKARLGLRFDINTGGFRKGVHVAPDIDIQWAPSHRFAAYLRAVGGEVMNTNSQLWERDAWMNGAFAMERSHVNADVELGLTFGSYRGFWATLSGGFASVSNWVRPVQIEGVNTWANAGGFSGVDFGLELGYAFRNLFTVTASAKGASHAKYYRWDDNAKWVVDLAAKVRPISKLQIELGYSVRVDRRGYNMVIEMLPGESVGPGTAYYNSEAVNLGDASNLHLGGEYEISPTLSVFLKAENLLNHHHFITNNVRSQGIHGLAGLQLKF